MLAVALLNILLLTPALRVLLRVSVLRSKLFGALVATGIQDDQHGAFVSMVGTTGRGACSCSVDVGGNQVGEFFQGVAIVLNRLLEVISILEINLGIRWHLAHVSTSHAPVFSSWGIIKGAEGVTK
jgi:hypothetical protein